VQLKWQSASLPSARLQVQKERERKKKRQAREISKGALIPQEMEGHK
jgi:hypothetical protein